jgi:hypothetical protein
MLRIASEFYLELFIIGISEDGQLGKFLVLHDLLKFTHLKYGYQRV